MAQKQIFLLIGLVFTIIVGIIFLEINFYEKDENNVNPEIVQENNDSPVVPSEYFTSEVNKIKILKNEEKAGISVLLIDTYVLEQAWPMIEKVLNAKIDNYDFFDNTENFENFLREITKDVKARYKKEFIVREGYFDINNPTQKIIVANIVFDQEFFVFLMNENFEMNILRYDNSYKPSVYFENDPIIISNEFQFFIGNYSYAGGTCSSAFSNKYFFYISNLRFLSALSIESSLVAQDEKPVQYDYSTACSYRSDSTSKIYYIDINGDNIKEIIVTRFKAPFEGGEDIIKDFWRFMGNDIYEWNSEKRIFEDVEGKNFLYRATEFISNDFPFVEFWTEAYCPNSVEEPQYNFQIPTGYNLIECIEGEKGSHGGCQTCAMSKIILEKVGKSDFNYITVGWEKEPIMVKDGGVKVYKIGEVLDEEYKGADVLFMYNTEDIPHSYTRIIRNNGNDIVLYNHSSEALLSEELSNDYKISKKIFISNLYPFENLQLNSNTSLVLDYDFHDYNTILFKEQENLLEKVNFNNYILYKRDGKFFALNNDGTIQKYNFNLSFTSCTNPWDFRSCQVDIKFINGESINDSYAIGKNQERECTFYSTPGYDYTDIDLKDLEKIGETADGNIFYQPKDIHQYFEDRYSMDYEEFYEDRKKRNERDYDFVVIFWQDPFGSLIEMMNSDFHNSIFKQC